ncbi:CFEM domain-containing protein [Colletotrichum tofieldiae]|nr:CFEM domain-containing protein [Colletotrichum tofieldiae]
MATSVLGFTEMMTLIWVLWAAALGMTIFRGSFQWILQRRLYADDYFIIAGLATLTALSAVITAMLPQFYLAGEYTKAAAEDPLASLPLSPEEFTARTIASLKLMFSQMLLFWTTLWAGWLTLSGHLSAKFSILFFVRRLVTGLPRYIHAWWACFVAVMLLYLACMFSNFLTCTPLTKYWSAKDLVRADASIKFATGADIAADVLIMVLPLNLLRKLTTSRSHKLGLAVLFSLGGIIIAFAIARLAQVTKATGDAAKDPTTVANGPVLLSMWSHIESSVSIIVATLPAFRFLLSKNRNMTKKTTNKYVGPTIGGSGMSLRSRKWQKGAVRLEGGDSDGRGSAQGSETELRPVRGIQKEFEYKVEQLPGESAEGETKRRTQELFA